MAIRWGAMSNSKYHTETGNGGAPRRQRMADNHYLRLLYAQKGRVLKGAIKSLDLRVSDIAKEIDVSQGHLSKILDTYCELDVATCEMYLKKVESALALRGVLNNITNLNPMLQVAIAGFE